MVTNILKNVPGSQKYHSYLVWASLLSHKRTLCRVDSKAHLQVGQPNLQQWYQISPFSSLAQPFETHKKLCSNWGKKPTNNIKILEIVTLLGNYISAG